MILPRSGVGSKINPVQLALDKSSPLHAHYPNLPLKACTDSNITFRFQRTQCSMIRSLLLDFDAWRCVSVVHGGITLTILVLPQLPIVSWLESTSRCFYLTNRIATLEHEQPQVKKSKSSGRWEPKDFKPRRGWQVVLNSQFDPTSIIAYPFSIPGSLLGEFFRHPAESGRW